MKNNFCLLINNGMTMPELSLSLMVIVIFSSLISLSAKFLQGIIKSSFALNSEKSSWIRNEHDIQTAMNRWEEVLSQSSYSRSEIKSLGCKYISNKTESLWDKPGLSDAKLPKNYKYCIFPTILGESNFQDLIEGKPNAKPGIYLMYAIPDEITPTSKPIRRIMCRPITFC